MLLAIDTSTSLASIALAQDRRLIAELTWEVGRRHSVELLPRLRWLLQTHGRTWRDLTLVAVATGPGSFNGLRVAVTTAKMLALGLRIPVVGVPTLDVIAWGAADVTGQIWATQDAGRAQLYAAAFEGPAEGGRQWRSLSGYSIVTPNELAAQVDAGALVCGEWSAETEQALREALGTRAHVATHIASRRAAWLAELALARAAAGESDDPAALEPLYLRRPGITSSGRLARNVGKNGREGERAESSKGAKGGEAPHALRR